MFLLLGLGLLGEIEPDKLLLLYERDAMQFWVPNNSSVEIDPLNEW
jgi:hypothetical protein